MLRIYRKKKTNQDSKYITSGLLPIPWVCRSLTIWTWHCERRHPLLLLNIGQQGKANGPSLTYGYLVVLINIWLNQNIYFPQENKNKETSP